MMNITNQVQRILFTNPAQMTIKPMRMTVRDTTPLSPACLAASVMHPSSSSEGYIARTFATSDVMRDTSAMVNSTLDTKTKSRRTCKRHLTFSSSYSRMQLTNASCSTLPPRPKISTVIHACEPFLPTRSHELTRAVKAAILGKRGKRGQTHFHSSFFLSLVERLDLSGAVFRRLPNCFLPPAIQHSQPPAGTALQVADELARAIAPSALVARRTVSQFWIAACLPQEFPPPRRSPELRTPAQSEHSTSSTSHSRACAHTGPRQIRRARTGPPGGAPHSSGRSRPAAPRQEPCQDLMRGLLRAQAQYCVLLVQHQSPARETRPSGSASKG